MRIIAGEARGRRLWAPQGNRTRPTPDRVREALFSIIAAEISGARILDLYSGSGALGIEALSRGAQSCTFVEHHPQTLAYLHRNLATLGTALQKLCQVHSCPVQTALSRLEAKSFDVVFLDPPYAEHLVPQTLTSLVNRQLLSAGACIVAEHASRQSLGAPPAGLVLRREKTFGEVGLSIFQYPGPAPLQNIPPA